MEFSSFSTRINRVEEKEDLFLSHSDRPSRRIEPSSSSTWTDQEAREEASSYSARLTEYDERRPSSSYSGKLSREEEKTSHLIRLVVRR